MYIRAHCHTAAKVPSEIDFCIFCSHGAPLLFSGQGGRDNCSIIIRTTNDSRGVYTCACLCIAYACLHAYIYAYLIDYNSDIIALFHQER
jgi:hypothetical protein